MKSVYRNFFLILIIAVAFFLRFWNVNNRYGIGYDGSRDALVAFESARQLQLPLTGSFSSIGPITFGPWYYYYITSAVFLIPLMWAPWISIGLASLLMVFVMYKVGNLLLNRNFGLILAVISAIAPAQISASTSLQQHALIGLLSALILYFFIRIQNAEKLGNLSILWGFLCGVAINIHFQAAGLLSLPLLIFLFSKKRKFIFPFILGFFISMIPILTFELNNHWFETRNILDYIFIGQYRVWTSNRWLTFLGQFWPDFWSYVLGIPVFLSTVIMFTTALLLAVKLLKKKLSFSFVLISASFAIQLILLRYYRGEKFFGYLQFFHPFIFIYTGYLFYTLSKRFKNKVIFSICLIGYFLISIPNSLKLLAPDKFTLETRNRVNLLADKYPNRKFSTYECGNAYERNRIQGLLVFLYMNKQYDQKGEKVTFENPFCSSKKAENLGQELVNLNNLEDRDLQVSGFVEITPLGVYNETARWWFKEQP